MYFLLNQKLLFLPSGNFDSESRECPALLLNTYLFFRRKQKNEVYRKAELSLGSLSLAAVLPHPAGVKHTHRTKTTSPRSTVLT